MSVVFQDYYEILGVNRQATQADIQKAYRKMARKYHPDVNKDKGAEDKFKKVNEAYEVLKTPQTRKKYDQLGSHWRSGEPFSPPRGGAGEHGFDFSEAFTGTGFSSFFDMLFGSQTKQNPYARQYSDSTNSNLGAIEQEATIDVTLEESLNGVEKDIIVKPLVHGGSGHIVDDEKRIRVRIPPGAIEGSKIRLKGQGRSKIKGGRSGDLVLKVRLIPNPKFNVEKHDLIGTLRVSPWEAALGAKVNVATLGKDVTVLVPAGSQGGQRLRLKGKGLPRQRGEPGDMYYEIQIVIPKILSDEERKHFEAISKVSQFKARE